MRSTPLSQEASTAEGQAGMQATAQQQVSSTQILSALTSSISYNQVCGCVWQVTNACNSLHACTQ
jgi:hypothetical protein